MTIWTFSKYAQYKFYKSLQEYLAITAFAATLDVQWHGIVESWLASGNQIFYPYRRTNRWRDD